MIAIEALGLLIVLLIAILLYRWLIHSRWFARMVGSIVQPSPETADEVIEDLTKVESDAWQRSEEARLKSIKDAEIVREIRRHVRRKPTPF